MESVGHEITYCPITFQGVVSVYIATSSRREKNWPHTDHMPSRYWEEKAGKNRIVFSPFTLMGILNKVISVPSIFKEIVQNL